MKRHHRHRKDNKECRRGGVVAVVKCSLLSKALLTTTCYGGPLVVIAATSSTTHHRLDQCAAVPPELSTCDEFSIYRYRKQRQRIKDRQVCLKHIFECRGGDATMDDNNNMLYPQLTDYTLNQRANDVIPAAATAIIHPSTTHHDLNDKAKNVINTSSSSSTMTNNNQRQPNGQKVDDDISQADTFLNQALQNQSIAPQKPPQQQQQQRLMVQFDTQALNSGNSDSKFGNRIRSQIRSRMGNENDWDRVIRQSRRGAALSISLDLSPPNSSSGSTTSSGSLDDYGMSNNNYVVSTQSTNKTTQPTNLSKTTLTTLLITTYTLLQQSTLLLPPLLLSRRILNSTRNAIVDYFRGRIFRTTFTRMERAYLRYYEFPAAIRAVARLGSQIGILLVLSVAVRCWMFMILAGDVVGPLVLGMSGVDIRQDIGMVGTSSSVGSGGTSGLDGGNQFDGILGNVWNVGLPCHQRGRGMAWLCGLIWIGAVVGTGHACTVALSVWGGPLRLQAAAVQAERPKQLLLRAVHHPIKWFREMEEWKHLPDPKITRKDGARRRRGGGGGGGGGSRAVDLDPLLFPATWLPLRWIQIFAVAKAFSTDPQNYRWCSPENDRIVIPKLMKQYLIQLALGDEWQRVCLGEKRVGLGILVVLSYFIALVMMVFTAFTLDGGSAAMLIPSVLAAIISGAINVVMFWKRLETRSQKKALEAIGWA